MLLFQAEDFDAMINTQEFDPNDEAAVVLYNIEEVVPHNIEPNEEEVIPHNIEPNEEDVVSHNIEPNEEDIIPHNIEPNEEDVVPHNIEPNEEEVIPQNIEPNEEDVVPHNIEVNEEDVVPHNIEPNEEVDPEEIVHFNSEDSSSSSDEEWKGRPKKGRKRKYSNQNRQVRKKLKNSNKKCVSQNGKTVYPKEFRDFHCSCRCNKKISVERRRMIFTSFYDLGDYNSQNMFLCAHVTEKAIQRKRVEESNRRFTREYKLDNVVVCRNHFIHTLRVSTKRVNTALKKMKSDSITDKRGQSGGRNKLDEKRLEEVRNHIRKIPTYKSHYCRSITETKYLPTEMTLPLMYGLYKEEVDNPVSQSKYNSIFYSEFNLKRKPLKKDTCSKCDSFKARLQSTNNEEEIKEISENHQAHLELAEEARLKFKNDLQDSEKNDLQETLSFDLQKTLPLPRLPTNIVYYKRQIMLYNLGIHSGKTNQGHFYVWVEGTAGRGAQEVGSCLKRHILEQCPNIEELVLWSDSCGGQNRNIKIVLMLKHVMSKHSKLKKITLRFLIPGHSFLPNDSEFGDVECHLKTHQRIYTDNDYINIMQNSRKKNKFLVNKLTKEDFLSTATMEEAITNRKQDTSGNKINWLQFREIELNKDRALSILVRTSFSGSQKEIDLGKRRTGRQSAMFLHTLPLLWPDGKPISDPKLKDVKSLLNLIPSDAKQFYRGFFSHQDIEDDIDGFNTNLDFEVEIAE
jgi:hypothetical protein